MARLIIAFPASLDENTAERVTAHLVSLLEACGGVVGRYECRALVRSGGTGAHTSCLAMLDTDHTLEKAARSIRLLLVLLRFAAVFVLDDHEALRVFALADEPALLRTVSERSRIWTPHNPSPGQVTSATEDDPA